MFKQSKTLDHVYYLFCRAAGSVLKTGFVSFYREQIVVLMTSYDVSIPVILYNPY